MCGIAGLFEYAGGRASPELVEAMAASLAHRGPDAGGTWVEGPIGLGHRRLSILDPTEASNQPLRADRDRAVLTYNGEIYNYRELRAALEAKGHHFTTRGDTEVVARAWMEWGPDCLTRFSGIFAFALWDAAEQRLFLARDPLGVKPLFYADDGRRFHFASEIKAILRDPRVDRTPSDEGLDAFFTFSYSAAPLTGRRAVRQIPPGHYAVVDAKGCVETRYWEIPYRDTPDSRPFGEQLEEFRALLDRAVTRQLVSDVPVGLFLSGGLDSSAVAASVSRSGGARLQAFSAGFAERAYDERPQARIAADAAGVDLIEEVLDIDSVALLPEIARHMDEPTADSSMLPVYLLSRMTARHVKVVLAGDGADELLAGYETYRASEWARYYRMIPGPARRGLIAPLAHRIPMADRKYNLHQVATRFVDGAEAGPGRDHASWRLACGERVKRRIYTAEFRARCAAFDPVARYASLMDEVPATFGRLGARLHADLHFHLPNDMLVKVDRMSMAHGLEVRVPFLDVDLVAFCANLPPDAKLHRGKIRKHILRESLRGFYPDAFLERPKAGFNIPLEAWMRKPKMRDLLFDELIRTDSCAREYLDVAAVEAVWREHAARRSDHGHALFAVLMFALWCGRR